RQAKQNSALQREGSSWTSRQSANDSPHQAGDGKGAHPCSPHPGPCLTGTPPAFQPDQQADAEGERNARDLTFAVHVVVSARRIPASPQPEYRSALKRGYPQGACPVPSILAPA